MDVNLTRFHLVFGPGDWLPTTPDGSPLPMPLFDWNSSDATLMLHRDLFIFPQLTGQSALDVADRRGAARDRYGNWYWIAQDALDLRFLGMNGTDAQHFWASSDEVRSCPVSGDFFVAEPIVPSAQSFSGLAISSDHYLIAGIAGGLLVFDLYAGGPPSYLIWPSNVSFQPFDMAAGNDGSLFVLDRDHKLLWKLNRHLRVESMHAASVPNAPPETFTPVTGVVANQQTCLTNQVTFDFAASLSSLSDPVAIECLPDGSVVILDNPVDADFSIVHRFQSGVETGSPLSLGNALSLYVTDTASSGDPDPQAVRGYDFAFVPVSPLADAVGTLYIAQIFGDQSFAFDVVIDGNNLSLSVRAQYFPMRKFGGKGIVGAQSTAYYDFQEIWVPLVEQPQARYQTQAQLLLPNMPAASSNDSLPAAFDGTQPGCVWHRIFIDACIAPGAGVRVESRAADQRSLLPSTPWQSEPAPYLRSDGAEIPYYNPQLPVAPDRSGTWELLFQRARGRYLQLRLTLSGNGRSTPRLQALRIYYPRFSYLKEYLPAVYQDDPVSASFLDRYLANVEGFYTVLEGKIAAVQELFDPRTIPAEYLDWLGTWMGIVLDGTWSDRTKRLVLSHAAEMFRERGTPDGIIRAIRLMLDACPDDSLFDDSPRCTSCNQRGSLFSVRIVERFLTRSSPLLDSDTAASVKGPAVVDSSTGASTGQWGPAQGSEPLNAEFRCYLQQRYDKIDDLNRAWSTNYSGFDDNNLVLPPVQPSSTSQARDWQNFLRDGVKFTYAAVTAADQPAYQKFLSERYSTIGDLNAAWNLIGGNLYSSFSSIALPSVMPSGPSLVDWIRFVSAALPIQQNAHAFTVLVPVTLNDTPDVQQTKLAIAQRITQIEKPAHTSFDVRLYWGMFRAGEARLALDTLLGSGSRFAALVLGSGYLGSGIIASADPLVAKDRFGLGPRSLAQKCCQPQPQVRCV